jgi:hypothetical protein
MVRQGGQMERQRGDDIELLAYPAAEAAPAHTSHTHTSSSSSPPLSKSTLLCGAMSLLLTTVQLCSVLVLLYVIFTTNWASLIGLDRVLQLITRTRPLIANATEQMASLVASNFTRLEPLLRNATDQMGQLLIIARRLGY